MLHKVCRMENKRDEKNSKWYAPPKGVADQFVRVFYWTGVELKWALPLHVDKCALRGVTCVLHIVNYALHTVRCRIETQSTKSVYPDRGGHIWRCYSCSCGQTAFFRRCYSCSCGQTNFFSYLWLGLYFVTFSLRHCAAYKVETSIIHQQLQCSRKKTNAQVNWTRKSIFAYFATYSRLNIDLICYCQRAILLIQPILCGMSFNFDLS